MSHLRPNLAVLGPDTYDLEDLREYCDSLVASTCSTTDIFVCNWDFERMDGEGYGPSLGRALARNTSVTSLNMEMRGLLGPHQDDNSNDLEPLLQYMATSESLSVVSLLGGADQREVLTDRVLNAVAQNPNITDLRLWENLYLDPESFLRFLMAARFIPKMELHVVAFCRHSTRELEAMVTAVAQNQTLQELRLVSIDGFDNGIGELILSQLGSVENHLSLLQVNLGSSAPITQFQALARVLVSSRTLTHLMLTGYSFNSDSMEVFLGALRTNQTVTCLTLEGIEMVKAPFDLWTQFLQSSDSLIHEVRLKPAATEGNWRESGAQQPIENMLDTSLAGEGLLSMLTRSSVHVLNLLHDVHGWVPGYDSLFDGMASQESDVRLSKLSITALEATNMAALIGFLTQATLLQDLTVVSSDTPEYSQLLLSASRRNGSLCHLTWKPMKKVGRTVAVTVPDAQWLKLTEAYSRRNEQTPKLLATLPHDASAELADGEEMSEIHPGLVPTLFAVGKHTPRTASNVILIGLLGVLGGDEIRPCTL
jgi:hypothetical protein